MWRIKHVPTGFYFIPVRSVVSIQHGYTKSNLSRQGKVYTRKPTMQGFLKNTGGSYYSHLASGRDALVPVQVSDWIVEDVT